MNTIQKKYVLVVLLIGSLIGLVPADVMGETPSISTHFVHPGGLHTREDLDRMRAKVAAHEHPWIDSWNALLEHPKAQLTYKPAPGPNMGSSRQHASADAVAAYLNAIRGYVSGDTAYTDNAVRICNLWSAAVNQSPSGTDQPGLNGIFTYEFAVVGELLRAQVGIRWEPADFDRFKTMMSMYLYPPCHDFLVRHDNAAVSHFWANWDICNMDAILAIGVLCDDRAKYNEAVEYFKDGRGNGSIRNAVPFLYPGGLGQWQETGRDQEHAQLGVGMMACFCQIAWNQGDDLYGYDNNRFLAGAEYVAAYNMWQPVPYTFYNNADNVNNYWASEQTWGGRGRLQRPIWEMIYNHYVVFKGMKAPNVKAMAELYRPEGFENDDNFGFGTLTYTLEAAASPYPPAHVPAAPKGLTATPGVGRVWLQWSPGETASGYIVSRATRSGGPYQNVASYAGTFPVYEDEKVTNGTTYYYTIAAKNQAGSSDNSLETSATSMTAGVLPVGWEQVDIGSCSQPGKAGYGDGSNPTFVVNGTGEGVGGKADGLCFACTKVSGIRSITARRAVSTFAGGRQQKIGVMIRESLDPDANAATMVSGDVGAREARFGTRSSSGSPMRWQNGDAYTTAGSPTWFRLTRSDDTFTAYQSIDGSKWFAVGSPVTLHMRASFYVGFAVASNGDKPDSADFDNVKIER